MIDTVIFIEKPNLTQNEMQEAVFHTAEPASTIEATVRIVKIIYSTYSKTEPDEVVVNSV